ncbi:MAG: hypothetical protein IT308_01640 [Anaerolineaceae bacterium]|nr:hypothetical protein [Anaerolineaceae bacterium]
MERRTMAFKFVSTYKQGMRLGVFCLLLATGCSTVMPQAVASAAPTAEISAAAPPAPANTLEPTASASPAPTETPSPTVTPAPLVPNLEHIVFILFENKEFSTVIGNPQMPTFNRYARENTLLGEHYAILHPSLPNYIALVGGDTFGITTNYPEIVIDAPAITDFVELSGRTWKTYQESMPEPCYLQDTLSYVQKHNPFIFFKSIRENPERCRAHVVPMEALEADLQQGTLPNYVFITPNLCHSAHDTYSRPEECNLRVVDDWLAGVLDRLTAYPGLLDNGVIILTWDEGQGEHTCCGLETGGGRIPTVLISNQVQAGFLDSTPYTHYSVLRTIAEAWTLPLLGYAADAEKAPLILAPWQ